MARDEAYKDFIKEALIDPIRSVLIVDDDYPTLDEMLSASSAGRGSETGAAPRKVKSWVQDPGSVKAVLDHFRSLAVLVDVDDASEGTGETPAEVARHLHQSDLLILDYHLDESDSGDRAIDIARAVAANDHFNLVVVNTRHTLSEVFENMLLGLLTPLDCLTQEADREAADGAIADVEGDFPDAQDRIKESIGLKHYMYAFRHGPSGFRDAIQGKGIFGEFKSKLDEFKIHPRHARPILLWALGEFQESQREKMSARSCGTFEWSDEAPFWIRSDRLFMAFSEKAKGRKPLEVLLEALCRWGPPPSRLILAKFRAEMEAKGVVGESKVVADTLATAHWYLTLLKAEEDARNVLIEESIGRHAEQLVDDVANQVRVFADKLSSADRAVGEAAFPARISERFGTGAGDVAGREAAFAANAVACSKTPRAWHLHTGHIFSMDRQLWVCLTPICDMVPGQKRAGHRGEVGSRKPFIAVRLHPLKDGQLEGLDVNSNNYLFLKLDGKVRVYSSVEGGSADPQPHWYLFYADDFGKVGQDLTFKLSRLRDVGGSLTVELCDAKIVSELRYEYAINLMHKLGGSLTRVGLDFSV
ncbi:MAG: response regulator receiver domain [Allosphingosinicella sp.]|uniref:response regulator receiver domain n=1 Tax=Allosphingosinicella sp. TaxID=2823234 RepID=UPI00392611D1